MKKIILFTLIFLLNITCVNALVQLPYTDTVNTSSFTLSFNESEILNLYTDNQIYSIQQNYIFGYSEIPNGIYYSNISINTSNTVIVIQQIFIISNDGILSKNVNYTLNTIESGIITNSLYNEYKIFKTTYSFAKTKMFFIDNKLTIENTYTDTSGYNYNTYELTLPVYLTLTHCTIENNYQVYSSSSNYIEYSYIGIKPKTYYINKLSPIFKYPYTLIKIFDKDNTILNIFLILSYFMNALIFWIKVLYKSLFIVIFLILILLIPYISYIQSYNQMTFIKKLFENYFKIISFVINSMKYFIQLIIDLIKSIPFV